MLNKLYNIAGWQFTNCVYKRQNRRAKLWHTVFNYLGKVSEKYV